MTMPPLSLIELQDNVLDFLLRYRAETEPDLRFALRRSNAAGLLNEGHWFMNSPTEGYFTTQFWSFPAPFVLNIFTDGRVGLFCDLQQKNLEKESKNLFAAFESFQGFEHVEMFKRPFRRTFLVRWYLKDSLDILDKMRAFLKSDDRRKIETAIKNKDAWSYNPLNSLLGNERINFDFIDETEFQSMLRTVMEFREKRQKSNLFPPLKPSKPKSGEVPISLESLFIHNFQGIEKTELVGLPRAPWIFLTGNNGYGKSCLLRAIFIGFNGKRDGDTELANGGTDIVLRYWDDEKVTTNSSAEAHSPSLAAYGPHRLEITDEISKEQRTDRSSASFSLFKTSAHLLNIEGYLRDWYTDPKRKSRYTSVVKMFKSLMPGIGDIFFDEDSRRILYCEKDLETGDNLPPLDFLKLASGFKNIIAFVGDMCVRFFESNPSWNTPHDFMGIVIIDELDLHLHPIWQRQLPALLSKVFPKIQFIASTHSPIPILGAPKDSILFKVDRTKEEGITVERLDIDVSTLLPNTILTSPIFGFQEIFPESFNDEKQRITTETTYEGAVLNDVLDQELLDLARKSNKAKKFLSFTQQA